MGLRETEIRRWPGFPVFPRRITPLSRRDATRLFLLRAFTGMLRKGCYFLRGDIEDITSASADYGELHRTGVTCLAHSGSSRFTEFTRLLNEYLFINRCRLALAGSMILAGFLFFLFLL